jgi:hypothetical protein
VPAAPAGGAGGGLIHTKSPIAHALGARGGQGVVARGFPSRRAAPGPFLIWGGAGLV